MYILQFYIILSTQPAQGTKHWVCFHPFQTISAPQFASRAWPGVFEVQPWSVGIEGFLEHHEELNKEMHATSICNLKSRRYESRSEDQQILYSNIVIMIYISSLSKETSADFPMAWSRRPLRSAAYGFRATLNLQFCVYDWINVTIRSQTSDEKILQVISKILQACLYIYIYAWNQHIINTWVLQKLQLQSESLWTWLSKVQVENDLCPNAFGEDKWRFMRA